MGRLVPARQAAGMTETSRPGRHSSWARLMTFPQVLAEPSRAQTQGLAPSAALEPGTSPGAGAAPACSPCGRTPPPLPALQGVPRRLLQNSVPTAFPVAPSPASFLPALGALTPHLAAGGDCGGPHTELRSTSGQASSAGEPPGPCAPTRRPLAWVGGALCPSSSTLEYVPAFQSLQAAAHTEAGARGRLAALTCLHTTCDPRSPALARAGTTSPTPGPDSPSGPGR